MLIDGRRFFPRFLGHSWLGLRKWYRKVRGEFFWGVWFSNERACMFTIRGRCQEAGYDFEGSVLHVTILESIIPAQRSMEAWNLTPPHSHFAKTMPLSIIPCITIT